MITRTFYDTSDLVDLVSQLREATFELITEGGRKYFTVTNYTRDGEMAPVKGEALRIDGDMMIPLYDHNTDAAYKEIEAKIKSGEWEKNDDCA